MSEPTRLPNGLEIHRLDTSIQVTGPNYGTAEDGKDPDDYAIGATLKEAQVNYWYYVLEKTEPMMIDSMLKYREAKEDLSQIESQFSESNAEIIEAEATAKAEAASTENEAKKAAIQLFELTGNKTPGVYVEIKEKAAPLKYDKVKAVEWCRENMKAAILEVLDTAAFESYSKVTELDFVEEQDKVPSAQISRKKVEDTIQHLKSE